MQNAIYTACDSCATIVDGKQGTADVKRNFLSIQGSLCLNLWNIDTDRHEFYYASQKGDVTRLHFCDEKCMIAYLNARRQVIVDKKNSWHTDPGYGDYAND
jgi:hypothetical protein